MRSPQDFKKSQQTNPESLLHPAVTRKHANPAFFFFLPFFFPPTPFSGMHTQEKKKPAKCLIHDSYLTLKKPDEKYLCLHGTGEMQTL